MFPFLNGTGSYAGPQTHGFNPTPAEVLQQQMGNESHLQALQRAAMMHPMANMASSVLANNILFPGDPATARQWMNNTTEGQIGQQLAAAVASTGIMGLGRSGDMLHGIQNMVANSGMRMGVQGMPGSSQFYGAGFLTDQVSLGMMSQLTNEFYSTGRKTFDARGLNMTDVGHIMSAAGTRGVFAGRQMFDLEAYTEDTIAEDLQKAQDRGDMAMVRSLQKAEPGQVRMRLNDHSDKIKTFVQDTGELLGDLRDLYGNLPVEELLMQAEAITGMGIEEMGGPSAIKSRINRITGMAQAYGLNPQAVLQASSQTSQGLAAQMSSMYGMSPDMYRRTSAAFGLSATEAMIGSRAGGMESAGFAADHGIYQRQFSDSYRAAVAGQSSLAVMQQEYGAVEALFAADQAGVSGSDRTALRAAVAALQGAGTVGEREAARTQIDAALRQSGFGPMGSLTSKYGGDLSRMTERMSQRGLSDLANLTAGVDRASMLEYQIGDAVGAMAIGERYGFDTRGFAGTARALIGQFDAPTLDAILRADPDERIRLMTAAGMSESDAASLAAEMGGSGFSTAMREVSAEFRSNPMNASFVSQQKMREASDRSYQQRAIQGSLGRHRLGKAGMIEVGLAAIAGVGNGPTEANIMSYLAQEGKGMALKKNAAGGLELGEGDAYAMMKMLTGDDSDMANAMFERLGVRTAGEFADAIGTKEGFRKFHSMIMDNADMHGAFNKGDFFVTSDKNFRGMASKMDAMASIKMFENLGLGHLDDSIKRNIRNLDMLDVTEKLVGDNNQFNAAGQKLLSKFLSGDKGAASALKFYGAFNQDPILQGLNAREEELRKELEDANGSKKTDINAELKRIKDMRSQLGVDSEGRNFVGVVKMIMGDEMEVNLYEQS